METIELFVDGNSSLDYTYFKDNFENGNFVYFVIRTNVADKYESDNEVSFRVSNMAEKKNELQNKYYTKFEASSPKGYLPITDIIQARSACIASDCCTATMKFNVKLNLLPIDYIIRSLRQAALRDICR